MIINKSFVNVYIREFVTTQIQIRIFADGHSTLLEHFPLLENVIHHVLVIQIYVCPFK